MREQIEVLKYVADVDPLAEDLFLFQFVQLVAFAAIADIVAIDLDKAFIDALQVVNCPQQRRFSRTGRPRITVTVPGSISSDTSSSALCRQSIC